MNAHSRRLRGIVVKSGTPAARPYAFSRGPLAEDELAPGLPPTPDQDLVFGGGRVLPNLRFRNLYVGGAQAWRTGDMARIDNALAGAMSDRRLNNVMIQYFGGRAITSTFLGSAVLPGQPQPFVTKSTVEALILELHQQGALAGMDLGATVIDLMLPAGCVLSSDFTAAARKTKGLDAAIPVEDEEDSLHGLGGYHGSVRAPGDGGTRPFIYYAVGVFSQLTGRRENGIVAFDEPWKNVVATFFHELNEARTDPDVEEAIRTNDPRFLGWTSASGEEVGDFPIHEVGNRLDLVFKEVQLENGGTAPIQLMYSNATHSPEGPLDRPA
jgi:hypothetical protein